MNRPAPFLLGATLLACIGTGVHAASYIDQRRVEPVQGDVAAGAAKAVVCVACHGPNGNAVVPIFPKLAGQRAEYIAGELRKFKLGTRPDSPMSALATPLTDEDIRNLAAYFAAQAHTPSTLPPADSATLARGEALYKQGDPALGAPPCQGCHGADATGPVVGADHHRAWPALRGQNGNYLVQRLQNYRDGKLKDSSNDFIMHGVARTLDEPSIRALAAYVSALPPNTP